MGVTSIAGSGMRAAMARMDNAACRIASDGAGIVPAAPIEAPRGASADDRGQLTFAPSSAAPVDTTEALIEAMTAGLTYRANAKVMRAGDSMIGALLNMQA